MDGRELGGELKRLRAERGWSQAELARRAGLSQQHLSLIESDASHAEVRTVSRILGALERSLAVAPALAARVEVWKRYGQAAAAFPDWTTPANDLSRVSELAGFYSARHPEPPSLAERRRFSAALRARMRRARLPG